jgi:ribosome-binding protein aMBF1 (putative translation factor)
VNEIEEDFEMGEGFISVTASASNEKRIEDQLRIAIDGYEWSLTALARESNIRESALKRFMDGERNLSLSAASRLCEYFGMRLTRPKYNRVVRGFAG